MSEIDNLFNKKDFEYFDYIIEHKKNVMIAYNIMNQLDNYAGIHNCSAMYITKEECEELKKRVIEHDLSKLSKEEFDGYRKYFFITEGEETTANHMDISGKIYNENEFKKSLKNHCVKNSHHPEFHKGKMSRVDMLEMILDWCAMSLKFGGNPFDYFMNKKDELEKKFKDIIDFEYVEKYVLPQLADDIVRYKNGEIKDIFKYY